MRGVDDTEARSLLERLQTSEAHTQVGGSTDDQECPRIACLGSWDFESLGALEAESSRQIFVIHYSEDVHKRETQFYICLAFPRKHAGSPCGFGKISP